VSSTVVLEDKYTHTFTDLTTSNRYTFPSEALTADDRFMLHFGKQNENTDTTSADTTQSGVTIPVENVVKMYAFRQSIYVRFSTPPTEEVRIQLFNLQGQEVLSTPVYGDCEIATGMNGIYILRMMQSNGLRTSKIILRP
jgi:hypothetical protein